MPPKISITGIAIAISSIFLLIFATYTSSLADGPSEYLPDNFQISENTRPIVAQISQPVAITDRRDWTVRQIDGEVRQENNNRAVSVGDRLVTGDRLITGTGGRVVLSRRKDKITISPNSDMKIGDHKGDSLYTKIIQSIGTLLFQVEKNPRQRFQVTTPFLAATVKGTTFTVSVRAEGAAVHVTDGAVQVASRGGQRAVIVRPGQTGSVSSKPGAEVEIQKREGKTKPAAGEKASVKEAKKNSEKGESKNAAKSTKPAKLLARAIGVKRANFTKLTKGFASNANIQSNSGKANGRGKKGKAGGDVVFREAANANGNRSGGNSGNGNSRAGATLASIQPGNSGRSNSTGNSSRNGGSKAGAGGGSSNASAGGGGSNSNAGGGGSNSNAGGGSSNSNAGGGGKGNGKGKKK